MQISKVTDICLWHKYLFVKNGISNSIFPLLHIYKSLKVFNTKQEDLIFNVIIK